jgi:leucine dehydrogenase
VDLLAAMQAADVEQVVAVNDPSTGLLGFIVLHDTGRGPGIGGCRLHTYADAAAALADGVALAQAMTRKCALAGLNAGGAKGVFIDHPGITDRKAMLRALGRFVEGLAGRFYTSGDLGVGPEDIAVIRQTSRYVAVPDAKALDLAGATAEGVLAGMRAGLESRGLSPELKGVRVAVQGLGTMGWRVAERLTEAGARVIACDIDDARAQAAKEALGVRLCAPDEIYSREVTVFSPCAISRVLGAETIPQIKAQLVAGTANNQLADAGADALLAEHDIAYAPDYAINAGAVILSATHFLERISDGPAAVSRAAARIGDTVRRVFDEAQRSGEPTGVVADRLAEAALVRPRGTEKMWWPVR